MKGRKGRKGGGGVDEPAEDLKTKPMRYTADSNVNEESEERKAGGRTHYRKGGIVHHERMSQLKHAKHLGPVRGEMKVHAGRKPRKRGGRAEGGAADQHPFSSARKGTEPADHKAEAGYD